MNLKPNFERLFIWSLNNLLKLTNFHKIKYETKILQIIILFKCQRNAIYSRNWSGLLIFFI